MRQMRIFSFKACLMGLAGAAATFMPLSWSLANAQLYQGDDMNIYVAAEKATYRGSQTQLEGKVDVRQGDVQIYADIMNIYRREATQNQSTGLQLGEVERIEAEGNFRYITPQNNVTGNKGVYNREDGIVIVTGNVVFTQASGTRVTGNRLVYDVAKRNARFGDECVGETCGSGRVTFGNQ